MFIDTHAHLFFKDFENDLDDVIKRAQDVGVQYIVCPGIDLETSRTSIELAEKYDCVYAAVGFHPHDAKKAAAENGVVRSEVLEEIKQLSQHPKVVAIGEIGLDYHYNFSPPDIQRKVFSEHIALARQQNLPIIIHCREAEEDTLKIIQEFLIRNPQLPIRNHRGVFHCFSGDSQMAQHVIGWEFYISIPGPVTFPLKSGKRNSMAEVVQNVPVQYILLETDSPYLTPHPFRGKRNEPANIPIIAKKIADIKGCSVDEMGRLSTAGACTFFGIPKTERQVNIL